MPNTHHQSVSLSGSKVAVITGAARRIGRSLARSLHDKGYDLILHYLNSKEEIDSLLDELNTSRSQSAIAIRANLNDTTEVQELGERLSKLSTNIHLLINNASYFKPDDQLEDHSAAWSDMMQINAHSSYQLAHSLKANLANNSGVVINLVDIYSERPLKNHTIYSTSKAAQGMLVKSLALEFAPDIRVNGISPGAIMWPEHQVNDHDYHQQLLSKIPLSRLGSEADICSAMHFILDCNYLHGQTINVDGGRSIQV